MLAFALLVSAVTMASADVSHLLQDPYSTSTESPPARPYIFAYRAGRYPGHSDRQHTEVSDGSGVIRGSYSYVDPLNKVRTVDYVADKQGFHPVLSDNPPDHPADTASVARAKDRHLQLYQQIAEQHANNRQPPAAQISSAPRQSAAVAYETAKHAHLFQVIAEQHARIAAEREDLQREAEEQQYFQELNEQH